jgi:DNA-binding MarR family transcriptional regulator
MNMVKRVADTGERQVKMGEIRPLYLESLHLVDINAVQALLLYNIGDCELTAGELRTRGYYLGSNVSYNLKKLVEMDFLHHQRSRMDRRSVRISLTEKGREVHKIIAGLYEKHIISIEHVGGIGAEDFRRMNVALVRLERFWTDQIRYRL